MEMGDGSWTCPRREGGAEATAHLGFLKAHGSRRESLPVPTGYGKCMVFPVPDTKASPGEFLTTVCPLVGLGFKFTLPMWSRKPPDEKGVQNSLCLVLPYVCTTGLCRGGGWAEASFQSLIFNLLPLQGHKQGHSTGQNCLMHRPSPSCKETHGLSIFSRAQG